MRQYAQFGQRRRLDEVKTTLPVGVIGVDAIKGEHMEKSIDVRSGPKPLCQRVRF